MDTNTLRKSFLAFFKEKTHAIVPSAPLVLVDDPTVMFTSAGMNQFKEYFLGIKKDVRRAASCQKCLRTGDIDRVGKTDYHHTFFEMLGNFSFGDYFKDEAISWAWEFLTKVLHIPSEKLWVSVFAEDREAYSLWKDTIGLPKERIVALGADTNFWPQNAIEEGPDGPCGPCSEIFFDKGKDTGCRKPTCSPACSCGRFVEIWNLVFTQFNRQGKGTITPLPNKNIDTGMGLERLAAVMQGVESNFQTDLFAPILKNLDSLIGKARKEPPRDQRGLSYAYAIADHARAATFLICEGVLPSNESRGYVLRMLIRRAFRNGVALGLAYEPFLYSLVAPVVSVMKEAYPALQDSREEIAAVVREEEKKFIAVLHEGMHSIDEAIAELKKRGGKTVDGETVFKLYDTYGFPAELTQAILEEKGLSFDRASFEKSLARQKELSRQGKSFEEAVFTKFHVDMAHYNLAPTRFTGYETLSDRARVTGIFDETGKSYSDTTTLTGTVFFVLEATPFYAESGGQVGDSGVFAAGKETIRISDTKKIGELHLHVGHLSSKAILRVGDTIEARVDEARRLDIMRNHTATHLLQAALRKTLGAHVKQLGSYVADGYFRFDFSHGKKIDKDACAQIEAFVNAAIMEDRPVHKNVMSLEEATKAGALAFFGEKYKDRVRVIMVEGISQELCGGTHVARTGQIGMFAITAETAISAGVRRIEAKTGRGAYALFAEQARILERAGALLKAPAGQVIAALENNLAQLKEAQKSVRELTMKALSSSAHAIAEKASRCEGICMIVETLRDRNYQPEEVRGFIDMIKKDLRDTMIIVGAPSEAGAHIVIYFTKDLVAKGLRIEQLAKDIAQQTGARGGGRNQIAQLGGIGAEALPAAMHTAKAVAESFIRKNIKAH
jgi:alanyl-tRNA synthetase